MITAEQIMNGELATTTREFDIKDIGKMVLHRLPADTENQTRKLFSDNSQDTAKLDKLEKLALRNTYYMLHGKFNDKESAKLLKTLDVYQLTKIHTTGLFFTNLEQENLEGIEKN